MDIATYESCAKIKVIGIGTSGINAVDRMIENGVDNIEFISVDTVKWTLDNCKSPIKIFIGEKLTRGLGAGGRPERGRGAAEESRKEISRVIDGADMVIIIAGMGGGTGTGSAPIVAEIAKSKGILTLGIVTKPCLFELKRRMKRALEGINALKDNIDTLIVISNQKILESIDKSYSEIADIFKKSDDILCQAVQSVTDLITKPSFICLDLFDIRAIMSGQGFACIGIGRASGKNRFEEAAMSAIKNPLLETTIHGTANILISIVHDKNSHLFDINKAICLISEALDIDDAEILFGAYPNDELEDEVIITIIKIEVELEETAENFVYSEPSPDAEISIPFTLRRRK